MANVISDETIEYVGILAKLALSDEEKEQAKKDMADMLDYIDQLGELDTEGVEPMSHIFDTCNVFREDVVTNGDDSENMLKNAPQEKDGMYLVPRTFVRRLRNEGYFRINGCGAFHEDQGRRAHGSGCGRSCFCADCRKGR